MTNEKLKEIIDYTIEKIKNNQEIRIKFAGEFISWDTLKCIGIEEKIVIYLSGADPQANELKLYLTQILKAKGLDNFEIIIYW